jgi:excisionase family DNA binding protein
MSGGSDRPGTNGDRPRPDTTRDILNIDEAAALLGVSAKTFNKVLHSEDVPARKVGREWKFSRQALIDWVGNDSSRDFYRENSEDEHAPASGRKGRRTEGWRIELD